jgi:hypothetical protein
MKPAFMLLVLMTASMAQAQSNEALTITVEEIPFTSLYQQLPVRDNDGSMRGSRSWDDEDDQRPVRHSRRSRNNNTFMPENFYPSNNPADPTDRAGKVIQVARDVVALGEVVYELVTKGKPTNQTEYAPVSVVPKDASNDPVDPFELENFSIPVEKKFLARVRQGAKEVVRFEYMVIFSYGGSHNGKGKYITGAQIIPASVKTNFGWNFNATMRVSGIMNHGSVMNPVAGVMLTMQFKANGWAKAVEQNETVHITGNGQIKAYNR